MEQKNWDRVKQIFQEALEKTGAEREQLVAMLCGGDFELRSQVEALLAAHGEAGAFLESRTVEGSDVAAAAAAGLASKEPPEGAGARVGSYKLLQQIGEGGFGVVYMAEQEQPIRRRVALKIIKPGMDTRQVVARFEAERQALAMMDHPNIAKVFDAGATVTGRPYFVMELVRGIPITEHCDRNRLSTRERLKLFRDTCAALHHAHQAGIIHRDIKPSNVLVTMQDGEPMPKVIDFGVAKATHHRLTEKTLFTEYSQFIGTPAYMSPEQAELGAVEVDARTDVYSLGVLLYELLTGSTPFDRSKLRRAAYVELLRILRDEEPPRPSIRLSTLGDTADEVAKNRASDAGGLTKLLRGDLDWIAMKAIEKNRKRRYASVAELAADIDRYAGNDPISARPPSAAYRIGKFVKKRRAPLAAAATIALAVTAAAAFGAWQNGARTTTSLSAATPAGPGLRLIAQSEEGLSGDVEGRIGRDGRDYLVRVRGRGIESVDIATGTRRLVVPDMPDNVGVHLQQLDISADGTRLVALVRHLPDEMTDDEPRLALHVFNVGERWPGTEIASWAPLDSYDLILHGWSPDDRRIWFKGHHFDGRPEIASVDVATGTIEVLESLDWGWDRTRPSLSPDGRFIAFSHASDPDGPNDIIILATDGSSEYRVDHPAHDTHAVFAPDGSGIAFLSDRRGFSDLWFLPVADGRPTDPPVLVWREVRFGDRGPQRFASNGSLFFDGPLGSQRIGTATIDESLSTIEFSETLTSPLGGELSLPAYSPSGRYLAYLRGLRHLAVRDLETGAERDFPVANHDAYVTGPKWCPDSSTLIFSGQHNGPLIHRIGLEHATVDRLRGPEAEACIGPGDTVLYAGPAQEIVRFDSATGTEATQFDGPIGGGDGNRILPSPDGSMIAFVSTEGEQRVRRVLIQPIVGGPVRELLTRELQPGAAGALNVQVMGWLSVDQILVVDLTSGSEFIVVPTDGSSVRPLRLSTPSGSERCERGWASNFSVHPDGHRVVFNCRSDWRAGIWAIDGLMETIRKALDSA